MLVSFCKGEGCPLKDECVRFTRKEPADHPKYIGFTYPEFVVPPYNTETKQCIEFWRIESGSAS